MVALAGGGDGAAVLAGDGADEEEAEAGALDLDLVTAGDAVEALEDALELRSGMPRPVSVMASETKV